MSRTKALNTYPQEYLRIVEGCALRKQVFELELPSITKALSIQGQFYAFRGAIRKALDKAIVHELKSEVERLQAMLMMAEQTVCWVDRNAPLSKVTVKFVHRDQTPNAELLRGFLESGKDNKGYTNPEDAEVAQSQQELLEKLQGKDSKYR